MGQGPGWNNKKAVTGFTWDPKEGRIKWADGSEIVPPKVEAEVVEAQKDRVAGQVAMDAFAGTQSMGPVYRQRTGVEYIPLDERAAVVPKPDAQTDGKRLLDLAPALDPCQQDLLLSCPP